LKLNRSFSTICTESFDELKVKNKKLKKSDDEDLLLIIFFIKSGILRRKNKQTQKEPALRTTVSAYHQEWLYVQRDNNEEGFEDAWADQGQNIELDPDVDFH